MDPDLANMFGDMVGTSVASGSGYAMTPTDVVGVSSTPSNPFTSNAGNIVSAGGDILGGIGGYMAGQKTAAADEYNAQLALMEGNFDVQKIDIQEGETLSTQKAMYSKAGVELSGSPLDTALNTATNYEYDKQITQFNAESSANMSNYEASVAKQKGQFDLASGLIKGAGALLPLAGLAL